jgi:hypothetical protein
MKNNTQIIRDFSGKIIGKIETDPLGNKIVRDFYGRILGRYDKKNNLTRDFYGRVVARGDNCGMLINLSRR